MSSKSLPCNFKQNYHHSSTASSLISSPPLLKPWFNNPTNDDNDRDITSWMRWSTLSGSLVIKKRRQKATAKRLWIHRKKRRTFPPSTHVLKQEQKQFGRRRQSFAKRIGKQPYHDLSQPPPTISSKSPTPTPPLGFPTPPKRFSAVYIDFNGNKGKVDYGSHNENKVLNFIQHGVFSPPQEPHCNHHELSSLDALLFLFGFLFFPFWWIGAFLHFRRRCRGRGKQHQYEDDLFSIQTFAYLNDIFSLLSLVLIIVIISLLVKS